MIIIILSGDPRRLKIQLCNLAQLVISAKKDIPVCIRFHEVIWEQLSCKQWVSPKACMLTVA